ncbi:SPOR domain-containing protein [Gryllotalpicola reticulitermitis]|uniref:SPOR domain-containing protein n=1 Tax=Gryllotalpicola reticulitermitis TaxID=1184153 RepID=A0ABV8Q9Y7_9MICO
MSDVSVPDIEHKWWFNTKTGAVEQGFVSPALERLGPFNTREEAQNAWEKIRENSDKWAAEEAEED